MPGTQASSAMKESKNNTLYSIDEALAKFAKTYNHNKYKASQQGSSAGSDSQAYKKVSNDG